MKKYQSPEVMLRPLSAQDVITLSFFEEGLGDVYSWSDGVIEEVE